MPRFKLTARTLREILVYKLYCCANKTTQFVEYFEEHGFEATYEYFVKLAFHRTMFTHKGVPWAENDITAPLYETIRLEERTPRTRDPIWKNIAYNDKLWSRLQRYRTARTFLKVFPPKKVRKLLIARSRGLRKKASNV